jgi:hypothetical protein
MEPLFIRLLSHTALMYSKMIFFVAMYFVRSSFPHVPMKNEQAAGDTAKTNTPPGGGPGGAVVWRREGSTGEE